MRALVCLCCLAAAISLAGATVPAALGADPTSCQAGESAGGAGVNVHILHTGAVYWCPASLIIAQSDVPAGTEYPIRGRASQSPTANQVSNGLSIGKLLILAGAENPASVGFTYVLRGNQTWATLTTHDLSSQPPFMSGRKPVVYINGTQTGYLRPQRGLRDVNADDNIVTQYGFPLDLYVSAGPLLEVAVSATPSRVKSGQNVTLTARVTNHSAKDGRLSYTWNLDDGATATGRSTTHAYSIVGTYAVTVTVHSTSGAGGASPVLPVTVNSPPTGNGSHTPAGTSHSNTAPTTGPSHSGGNTPGAKPSSQRHSGATTPSTASTSTLPSTTTPTAPATSVHPATGPARAGPNAPGRGGSQAEFYPGLTLVSGRLISYTIPLSAAQLAGASATAQPATAPSARLGGAGAAPWGAVAAGCVIILLFAGGAGREWHGRRRPLSRASSA